jgi:hypothetical protein
MHNTKGEQRLQAAIMCHCNFINLKKYATIIVRDVDKGHYVCGIRSEQGIYRKFSIFLSILLWI